MTSDFERYTQRLIESVSGDADVLGLVLIGSTADASYRDARSDHDFWLVVTDGAAARYRAKNAWLPNADSILCSVEHGAERRSILFRDGHMVEYAVFTPSERPMESWSGFAS